LGADGNITMMVEPVMTTSVVKTAVTISLAKLANFQQKGTAMTPSTLGPAMTSLVVTSVMIG